MTLLSGQSLILKCQQQTVHPVAVCVVDAFALFCYSIQSGIFFHSCQRENHLNFLALRLFVLVKKCCLSKLTLILLIHALWQYWSQHMPCPHNSILALIATFAVFGNLLQWRHPAWLIFSVGFPACSCILSERRTRGVGSCTLRMHGHLCKWAGACRDRLRTPESQHALYTV